MDAIILQAVEKIRCPFLDVFFAVFTALGEELIIAAIIAVIYICFSKRTGEQASFVMPANGRTFAGKAAPKQPLHLPDRFSAGVYIFTCGNGAPLGDWFASPARCYTVGLDCCLLPAQHDASHESPTIYPHSRRLHHYLLQHSRYKRQNTHLMRRFAVFLGFRRQHWFALHPLYCL